MIRHASLNRLLGELRLARWEADSLRQLAPTEEIEMLLPRLDALAAEREAELDRRHRIAAEVVRRSPRMVS